MNWNFGNQISVYSNIYGILFFYLTNELLECFGDAGEACARKATTEYGHFRGRLLAKDHIKKGYEINLASFQSHYDLPCDERSKKNTQRAHRPRRNPQQNLYLSIQRYLEISCRAGDGRLQPNRQDLLRAVSPSHVGGL